jgi:hypothetical protein
LARPHKYMLEIEIRAGRSVRDAKHVAGVEDYQVALATCCQVRVSQSV